ncbi:MULTISPECIES: ATP-binding protein [Butyricimonas]|uniref:ATP-binding protein n=1 Tax=Butyricimonas TaxID=574697 RepID=UPI002081CDBE|nr:ATP-binding protein [Butyricimonas paravirosa]BDF54886.1 ATPase AAA [Odoribacteraceae bacterium]GKH93748.1 ATPase AAA [Odoribacteraceae bacterium]GKH99366.1 ATPase AAA [Odoribacteraceae bacterium]GKI02831.1 ATPase AAA [Odoribacteraceae bacterium]
MSEKLYPIGIQNFESLRKDGYLYVDKTALIYQLAKRGRYYFLSRPRRFGKSLLISTLEAYFQGKRELFQGLAMEELEKEWLQHPILHLDLNIEKYDSIESLGNILNNALTRWEKIYGDEPSEASFSLRFAGIIRRAHELTGQRVVILVDEYDKPMLQAINNEELQREFRNTLKPFYGALKTMDGDIKFALLTGVTKFGKVSVFSDLNNLNDISMDKQYVSLCGMTEEEIHRYFEDDLRRLATAQDMTYEETCTRLKEAYDGYHFRQNSEGIYNPFSVLNTFAKQEFGSYWFETGTPTYLVELLKQNHYNLEQMSHEETNSEVLNSIYADESPIPVIYQSGYLTIKDYDPRFENYILGFPNREVEEGFIKFLMPFYTNVNKVESPFEIQQFTREIESGQPDAFLRRLQSFFADTPYELIRDLEVHYQNVLFIVFRLVGFYVKAEYHTSEGRVDLVLQTDRYIYVMEFKLEGSAEEALQQIETKHYARPFEADSRQLFKIGINFDNNTRNIERWIVE